MAWVLTCSKSTTRRTRSTPLKYLTIALNFSILSVAVGKVSIVLLLQRVMGLSAWRLVRAFHRPGISSPSLTPPDVRPHRHGQRPNPPTSLPHGPGAALNSALCLVQPAPDPPRGKSSSRGSRDVFGRGLEYPDGTTMNPSTDHILAGGSSHPEDGKTGIVKTDDFSLTYSSRER